MRHALLKALGTPRTQESLPSRSLQTQPTGKLGKRARKGIGQAGRWGNSSSRDPVRSADHTQGWHGTSQQRILSDRWSREGYWSWRSLPDRWVTVFALQRHLRASSYREEHRNFLFRLSITFDSCQCYADSTTSSEPMSLKRCRSLRWHLQKV